MSYVDPDGVSPALGTARVGAELRAARLRLGWALPDVASGLRIRLVYLEAIEEGRLSALPGKAYAVGFVRTYATSLGLDPDEVARRFRAEARDMNEKTELTFPAPVPQRGVPAGAVVLLGLLIAAGAYVGWYRYTGSEDTRVDADREPAGPPGRDGAGSAGAVAPGGPPSCRPRPCHPSHPRPRRRCRCPSRFRWPSHRPPRCRPACR